jgi:hypothetical protein
MGTIAHNAVSAPRGRHHAAKEFELQCQFTGVRTYLSYQITLAAIAMVAMKFLMLWSKRVETLRHSLMRQNMCSMKLR